MWIQRLCTVAISFSIMSLALGCPAATDQGAQRPSASAASDDPAPQAPPAKKSAAFDEKTFITGVHQVIYAGKRAGEGYFSADGKRMVFQSERDAQNPFYQIHLLDFESGDVERVSPGIGKTTCAWIHPDGNQVLYASTHHDPEAKAKMKAELDFRKSGKKRRYSWDYDPQFELFVRGENGKAPKRLTQALGYDAEASFSPDGKKIVFASNRRAYAGNLSEKDKKRLEVDPSYFIDLYIMDADGSNLKQLTDHPGYDGGPFFSADGKQITWRRFNAEGSKAEIFVMNVDGSEPRALTRLGAMSWAPYFHPSGDYLIFATNLHGFGNFELYMVDAAGKQEPLRVTASKGLIAGFPSRRKNPELDQQPHLRRQRTDLQGHLERCRGPGRPETACQSRDHSRGPYRRRTSQGRGCPRRGDSPRGGSPRVRGIGGAHDRFRGRKAGHRVRG
jgi:dipeptidyl aminopeptidase/acylaminoacyl peptidase